MAFGSIGLERKNIKPMIAIAPNTTSQGDGFDLAEFLLFPDFFPATAELMTNLLD